MAITAKTAGPLTTGKEIQVFDEDTSGAGTLTQTFSIDAESVLMSLYVGALSGDLTVTVYTVANDGHEIEIISFPTISAPTSELLLKKAASALQRIKVVVVFTDAADFNIRARGVSAEGASVKIEGASVFKATQTDVAASAGVLIAASLNDRNGILIINTNTSETLYLGGTLAETTLTDGLPVFPGGTMSIDIAAGQTIYALSSSGTLDIRIGETGAG